MAYGGQRRLVGFSALVDGGLGSADTRASALRRAEARGFLGVRREDGTATAVPARHQGEEGGV
ncbi:hypothetical protein ACFQ0M_49545 [Kitasatospora aburaviensis]